MTVSKFNLCGEACGDSVQLTQGPIPPGMGNYGMGQMEQHQVRKFVPHSRLEYLSIHAMPIVRIVELWTAFG